MHARGAPSGVGANRRAAACSARADEAGSFLFALRLRLCFFVCLSTPPPHCVTSHTTGAGSLWSSASNSSTSRARVAFLPASRVSSTQPRHSARMFARRAPKWALTTASNSGLGLRSASSMAYRMVPSRMTALYSRLMASPWAVPMDRS